MFQVDIRALDEASLNIQRHLRQVNQMIFEVEGVINGLNGMSGMDRVKYALRQNVNRMENQKNSLKRMLIAINQIEQCYACCERNIIDYAEDSRVKAKATFEWFSLPVTEGITHITSRIRY